MPDQTESLLHISHDVINKLAQAVTETDILQVLDLYLKPQAPNWLGLFYPDVLAPTQDLLLVASRADGDANSLEQWAFAAHKLSLYLRGALLNDLLIEDLVADQRASDNPDLSELVQRFRIGSLVTLSLVWGEQFNGLLTLCWTGPRQFSAADRAVYRAIAKPAAATVCSRRNRLAVERLRQQSETVAQMYSQLSQTKEAYQVYDCLNDLVERFGAEVRLLIRANAAGELYIVSGTHPADDSTTPSRLVGMNASQLAEGPYRQLVWVEKINDSASPLSAYLRGMGVQSYAYMPFFWAERWSGCFVAGWRTPQQFNVEVQFVLEGILPTVGMMLANHHFLKQVQNRVQFSETYLNAIFQYAPIGIHSLDLEGKITYSNGRLLPSLGSSPQEAVGRSWMDVFSESRERIEALVRRAIQGQEFSEVLALRGRQLWQQYAPLLDVDGVLIGSVGITQDITQYVEAEAKLRALSQQLIDAEERERHNLARELHDEIGQSLTAILYQLNKLERLSPDLDARTVTEIQTIVENLIVQIRELSLRLHPPVLDEEGLAEALRWYCSHFTSRTQIQVDLKITGSRHRLTPEIELTSYRVVQEALNNIARYAQTDKALVRLSVSPHRVRITVEDKGVGFDFDPILLGRTSYGLVAMRERLAMLKGKLSIQSKPSTGTRLCAEIPLQVV